MDISKPLEPSQIVIEPSKGLACQHLIQRRGYLEESRLFDQAYQQSQLLARKIQAMRKSLLGRTQMKIREDSGEVYGE